jgi:hypothetical protein
METLAVTVNYGLTVEEAILAGQYGWSNENVTSSNFPATRSGEHQLEAVLVHFDRSISGEKALAKLDGMDLRAGELHELLAVGAQHPDKQRRFPIVALGSKWQDPVGYWSVPYLGNWFGERGLRLGWFDGDWNGYCRFLAFRK